jgi:hypothetical protein
MKVDNAEYALLTAIVIFSGNAINHYSFWIVLCLQFEIVFVKLYLFKPFTICKIGYFLKYSKCKR